MRRRRLFIPRFRVRTLLAFVTLICALLGVRSWQITRERRALDRLRVAAQDTNALHAGVYPWYEYTDHRDFLKWTRRWDTGVIWQPADTITQLFYYRVVGVELFGDGVRDSSLADLRGLSRLGSLTIRDAQRITDDCVPTLIAIGGLRSISLSETAVTKDGAAKLERALPACRITWVAARPRPAISEAIADRHSREYSGLRIITMRGPTIDDAAVATLSNVSTIGCLCITEAPLVTDAGIKPLASASNLKELLLHGTAVTAEAALRLQDALPGCKIRRYPPGPRRDPRPVLPWWGRLLQSLDPASG